MACDVEDFYQTTLTGLVSSCVLVLFSADRLPYKHFYLLDTIFTINNIINIILEGCVLGEVSVTYLASSTLKVVA